MYTFSKKCKLLIAFALVANALSLHVQANDVSAAVQPTQFQKAIEYLHQYPVETLNIDAVPFCYRYTCRVIETIKIPLADWERATQALHARPHSAQMERALLSEVMSRIEVMVARITATQYDIGGTFKVEDEPVVNSAQLDCVDEAFNMHMYLHLLNNAGKLHWHRVGDIVHRGWLLDLSYPHTALTIVEKSSGAQYVVDSWFHDSGRPPEILSLQQWKSGWTPPGF